MHKKYFLTLLFTLTTLTSFAFAEAPASIATASPWAQQIKEINKLIKLETPHKENALAKLKKENIALKHAVKSLAYRKEASAARLEIRWGELFLLAGVALLFWIFRVYRKEMRRQSYRENAVEQLTVKRPVPPLRERVKPPTRTQPAALSTLASAPEKKTTALPKKPASKTLVKAPVKNSVKTPVKALAKTSVKASLKPPVKTSTSPKAQLKPRAPTSTRPTKDEGEFDYMNSPEALPAKLDLARAYIQMEDNQEARKILREVLEKGDKAQIKQAHDLLNQLSEKV